MGGPFGGGALPPDVTPAAPTPGTVTAGQLAQGAVQANRNALAAVGRVSPVAEDVLSQGERIGGDVLNASPMLHLQAFAEGLGETFDPASIYSHPEDMAPVEAPPKEAPGPVTAEQLQQAPDRLPPPPPRNTAPAAPAAKTPVAEAPSARQPVPGKPHIRLKAVPAEGQVSHPPKRPLPPLRPLWLPRPRTLL